MPGSIFQPLTHSLTTLSSVACDLVLLLGLISLSRRALAAENFFLRKQLALFPQPFQSQGGLQRLRGDHRRLPYPLRLHHHGDRIPPDSPLQRHCPSYSRTDARAFRESLPCNHPYRFVIHDRDRIFAEEVDKDLANLGVRVLQTPLRAPKGKLGVRATGRQSSARTSRLLDSLPRTPFANDSS
jgi:hypothetical protein